MMPPRLQHITILEMAEPPKENGLGNCFMTTKGMETSGAQPVEEKAGSYLSLRSHCSLEAMV